MNDEKPAFTSAGHTGQVESNRPSSTLLSPVGIREGSRRQPRGLSDPPPTTVDEIGPQLFSTPIRKSCQQEETGDRRPLQAMGRKSPSLEKKSKGVQGEEYPRRTQIRSAEERPDAGVGKITITCAIERIEPAVPAVVRVLAAAGVVVEHTDDGAPGHGEGIADFRMLIESEDGERCIADQGSAGLQRRFPELINRLHLIVVSAPVRRSKATKPRGIEFCRSP